jgi:hypothetical protein
MSDVPNTIIVCNVKRCENERGQRLISVSHVNGNPVKKYIKLYRLRNDAHLLKVSDYATAASVFTDNYIVQDKRS